MRKQPPLPALQQLQRNHHPLYLARSLADRTQLYIAIELLRGHSTMRLRLAIRQRQHKRAVGMASIGDKGRVPIQNPLVPAPHGRRPHTARVGDRPRSRQPPRAQSLAAREPRNPAPPLLQPLSPRMPAPRAAAPPAHPSAHTWSRPHFIINTTNAAISIANTCKKRQLLRSQRVPVIFTTFREQFSAELGL